MFSLADLTGWQGTAIGRSNGQTKSDGSWLGQGAAGPGEGAAPVEDEAEDEEMSGSRGRASLAKLLRSDGAFQGRVSGRSTGLVSQ